MDGIKIGTEYYDDNSKIPDMKMEESPKLSDPKHFDICEILPGRLWLSNEHTAFNYSHLTKLGIKQILTVGTEIPERSEDDIKNFNTMRIDIYDHHGETIYNWFDKANIFIERGPTLVHCVAGVSRSASIVIAYLMSSEKISFGQAYKLVFAVRRVCPNTGFLTELNMLERDLDVAKTRCHTCFVKKMASNRPPCEKPIYYHPLFDTPIDEQNKLQVYMSCSECVAQSRGHVLGRVCYPTLPTSRAEYMKLISLYNSSTTYNYICNICIDYCDGHIREDIGKFHTNLTVVLKSHPSREGYIENPLIYGHVVHGFFSNQKKNTSVLMTNYPFLRVWFSVVFDTFKDIQLPLEQICLKNATILLGKSSLSSEEFQRLEYMANKIKEYLHVSGSIPRYIPRFWIETSNVSLLELQRKYPELTDNKFQLILPPSKTFKLDDLIVEYQKQQHYVILQKPTIQKFLSTFVSSLKQNNF